MKQKITILLITLLLLLAGCGGGDATKQKELELKEKELALKERELNLNENSESKANEATKEPDKVVKKETKPVKTNESSDIDKLVGEWTDANQPSITMKFTRNGRFEFTDYNSKKGAAENLTGKFELKGESLTLLYDDRPKQTFKFNKRSLAGYSIEKGNYYLVK